MPNPSKLITPPRAPGVNAQPQETAAWMQSVTESLTALTRAVMTIIGNPNVPTTEPDLDLATANERFLWRDGSKSIMGNLIPDTANNRNLGSLANFMGSIYANRFTGDGVAGHLVAGDSGAPGNCFISVDSAVPEIDNTADNILHFHVFSNTTGAKVTAAASNAWQSGAITGLGGVGLLALEGVTQLGELKANTDASNYAMGSTKLTGLKAGTASGDSMAYFLNRLNHLAAASAAYDMDGNTFTDLGGCTSSNAAVLEFVGNIADGSDVIGINLRWNVAAAPAGQRFALRVQANDTTGARDLMKVGYNSASQATMWLPDSNGGGNSGISEYLLMAGGHSDYNFTDTVGFRLLPQFSSGSIWIYAGSDRAMTIQKGQAAIGIGASGVPWSLSSNDLYLMQSSVRDVTQGSYQMGFFDNTAPVSGRHLVLYRGLIPISGNVTGMEFSVDYLGKVYAGVNARASDTPTDATFGAHGWTEASTSNNQTGVDTYWETGPGTGSSVTKGDHFWRTPDAGGSGTAIQTLTTKTQLTREGAFSGVSAGANIGAGLLNAQTGISAGATDLLTVGTDNQIQTYAFVAGGGAYTYNIDLDAAANTAVEGSLFYLLLDKPASLNPTINVRNGSGGGNIISINNITAQVWGCLFVFDGTNWIRLIAEVNTL